MQGPHEKIRNVFSSGRVKLKSSRGGVSALFWSSLRFFSCHGQWDDCEYGSLLQGFLQNLRFQGRWPSSHQLNPSTGMSIQLAGALSYLPGMLWGPLWANRRICFHSGNQATVAILSAKSSKIPWIMNNIRLITFQTLKFHFISTAKHVPEVDNSIADSLSRFQMPHFCVLAPDESPVPCLIPPFPTNV